MKGVFEMKDIFICYKCKKKFKKNDLISYCAPGCKTFHNYCKNCLEEKKKNEYFVNEICRIFGLKKPGPRIYAEKKRLNANGFSDEMILLTLQYIYDVKKTPKLSETLYLVNITNFNKAKSFYSNATEEKDTKKIKYSYFKDEEKEESLFKIEEDNPDDFLGDE